MEQGRSIRDRVTGVTAVTKVSSSMSVTSDSVLLLYLHRLIYLLTLCNAVTHRVCGNILGTLFFDERVALHALQQHSDGRT